ncbi:MAG: hypothetical protein WC359_12295 [Dehalococcoidia bacterium]|jgi:hypothetical protein
MRPSDIGALQIESYGGARRNLAAARRPLVSLYEGWQDELGIDAALWTITDPATGAAWTRGAVNDLLMAYASPNANENCRIRSNQRWVAPAENYGVNRILRKFNLEFEFQLTDRANFVNTGFFMGLTSGIADTRASQNIIGWHLSGVGNTLFRCLVDDAGSEDYWNVTGEDLTLVNKLKIVTSRQFVNFYFNEDLVGPFNSSWNDIPNLPWYLNFYFPTGAGGAATVRLGSIRAWLEDE